MTFEYGQTVYFLEGGQIKEGVFQTYKLKDSGFVAKVKVGNLVTCVPEKKLSKKMSFENLSGEIFNLGDTAYYQDRNFFWHKGVVTSINGSVVTVDERVVFSGIVWTLNDPFKGKKLRKEETNLELFLLEHMFPIRLKSGIQNFGPELKDGKLWIFRNLEDFEKGRKTPMRIGRAIRYMAFKISDSEVERITHEIVENFCEIELTLKKSSDPQDFEVVYTSKIVPETRVTSKYHSLASSCMRGVFRNLPCHPARAYGSGDFQIWWTEDSEGSVCSRVIVCPENHSHGPIYASRHKGYEILKNALQDAEYYQGDFALGQRLLKIPFKQSRIVAPYIDTRSKELFMKEFGRDYLIVQETPSQVCYSPVSLSGVIFQERFDVCACCDEYKRETSLSEIRGEIICNDCAQSHYTNCQLCNQKEKNSELVCVGDYLVCRDCVSEVKECDHCQESVPEKELGAVYVKPGVSEEWCDRCSLLYAKQVKPYFWVAENSLHLFKTKA